jgi:hypothetical protein
LGGLPWENAERLFALADALLINVEGHFHEFHFVLQGRTLKEIEYDIDDINNI